MSETQGTLKKVIPLGPYQVPVFPAVGALFGLVGFIFSFIAFFLPSWISIQGFASSTTTFDGSHLAVLVIALHAVLMSLSLRILQLRVLCTCTKENAIPRSKLITMAVLSFITAFLYMLSFAIWDGQIFTLARGVLGVAPGPGFALQVTAFVFEVIHAVLFCVYLCATSQSAVSTM